MNSFHVIPIFVIMVIIIVSICVGKFFNMDITNIINIIAIMLAPIFAIYFWRIFQDRSERRADKMRTFKVLMRDRNLGWTSESVNELNTIYIIFSDDIDVINLENIKLIEAIANSL